MRAFFLGSLFPLMVSGCADLLMSPMGLNEEMVKAAAAGKHDQVVEATDKMYPDLQKQPNNVIHTYCNSAYLAKRYDKLQACFKEQSERAVRLANGKPVQRPSDCSFENYTRSTYDSCYLMLTQRRLRVKYALDIGDYAEALKVASELQTMNWIGIPESVVEAIGALAVANAHSGDRSAARSRLQQLEKYSPGAMIPGVHYVRAKKVWAARGYMAIGDFSSAYRVVSASDFSGDAARAVTQVTGNVILGRAVFDDTVSNEAIANAFLVHKAQLETGRLDEARDGFDRMLAVPAVVANEDIHWLVLFDRGRIAERERNLDEAIELYARAADLIDSHRATLSSETSKIGFVGSRQEVYRSLVRVLMRRGRIATAFEYVERSKARALVDMLAGKKDFAAVESSPERVRDLLAAVDATEQAARVVDMSGARAGKRALLVKSQQAVAAQAPELASLISVETASSNDVQGRLQEDESLVEYYYAEGELYIFVVTRRQVVGVRGDAGRLAEEVQEFRRAIQDGGDWKARSTRLYRRLVAPVRKHLTANITVVPHGALHYLPFNALHDDAAFLIERHSIRLLPAASVLKYLKQPAVDKPGLLLAFGNPDLRDARFDLAFAQAEAETIARALPRSRALTRAEATKTAFQRYASDFRIVHVASHGEFDSAAPLASSLLLAPDVNGNGRLTVSDLYSMRVDADLVTLSACETGLGKIANGDDVVGLTRGFLYAGARTIVSSLWQVDDRATGDLMGAFYDALRNGMGKREALRAAQLRFVRSQSPPFFWAAFQLTGRP